jgi:hypothetical protein
MNALCTLVANSLIGKSLISCFLIVIYFTFFCFSFGSRKSSFPTHTHQSRCQKSRNFSKKKNQVFCLFNLSARQTLSSEIVLSESKKNCVCLIGKLFIFAMQIKQDFIPFIVFCFPFLSTILLFFSLSSRLTNLFI